MNQLCILRCGCKMTHEELGFSSVKSLEKISCVDQKCVGDTEHSL